MYPRRLILLAAVTLAGGLAAAQVASRGGQSREAGDVSSAVTLLGAEHDRLSREFKRLADREDRRSFVDFLKGELVPYLTAAVVLYPRADSVAGTGGYAVAAALFDGEAIARQVKELDRLAAAPGGGAEAVAAFRARTLALAELVDLYFTKERLLIAPTLARLEPGELERLLAQIRSASGPRS